MKVSIRYEMELPQDKRDYMSLVHADKTEVYSRIVGFYRPVRNWNKGKWEEYQKRKMFDWRKHESKV